MNCYYKYYYRMHCIVLLTAWTYISNITATISKQMAVRTAVAWVSSCAIVCSHAVFIWWTAFRSVANASTRPRDCHCMSYHIYDKLYLESIHWLM